jgi:cell division protein WhiA
MSFAKLVKEELVSIPVGESEMLAEFSAFLNLSTEFHIENKAKMLDFKTNNPTVAKRFLQLVRSLYRAETSLITKKQNKLNQRQSIIIRISSKVEEIINEHSIFESPIENQELLIETNETKRAFLRAAFLSSGSINHPKTAEYHLEIFSTDSNQILFLQKILVSYDINAKITNRRNGLICYIKDAQGISDCLQLMGAQNMQFKFEDIRIKRDFNNSINRIMNCEIANEKKIIVAARDQIKDINLIFKYYKTDQLDPKMVQIMKLRKDNPEASLKELVDLYFETYKESISKSGLNHRLTKIKQTADLIKEGHFND